MTADEQRIRALQHIADAINRPATVQRFPNELVEGDVIVDDDGTCVEVLYRPRPSQVRPGMWYVAVGHPDIARHHWESDVLEVIAR